MEQCNKVHEYMTLYALRVSSYCNLNINNESALYKRRSKFVRYFLGGVAFVVIGISLSWPIIDRL